MRRIDPVLQDLWKRRADGSGSSVQLDAAMHARQDALLPAYRGVALKFAEMHDTPVRSFRFASSSHVSRQALKYSHALAFWLSGWSSLLFPFHAVSQLTHLQSRVGLEIFRQAFHVTASS
jgi:hypothetical protein